jgi:hypothetical protein
MSETMTQSLSNNENFNLNSLSIGENISKIEQVYDLIRRNEDIEKLNEFISNEPITFNVNEVLKNGDTLLCLACNKGLDEIAKILVEKYSADVNLCRNVNLPTSSFSAVTPTITISARRQSRLLSNSLSINKNVTVRGDSPISICIKYGFETLAQYLISKGADICGESTNQENVIYCDFEKSPLQEAIRFNRAKIIGKMFSHIFEKNEMKPIEWVIAKRYDILRQSLMAENIDTLRVVLPNIIENKRIDGEMLIHILNYLLMRSKIQERKEKVQQILETVMEIGTADDNSKEQFEIYNLDIFVRGFFATLKALFNAVNSEDSRTSILTYRTSLFFFIMKYQKALVNFEQFYADIDSTFDFFYTKMKETGENIIKLVEYFITFYDTLITMNHIHLTSNNVANLLRLEHVKKLDILGDFLIQRSLYPLDLKELARLKIKESMNPFNLLTISNLPILDQSCKDFLYFI